jgi:hypothetical protein
MFSYEPDKDPKWHFGSRGINNALDATAAHMDLNKKSAVGFEYNFYPSISVPGGGREINDWVSEPGNFGIDSAQNEFKMPMISNLNQDRFACRSSLWKQTGGSGNYTLMSALLSQDDYTLEAAAFIRNTTDANPTGYIVPNNSTVATGGGSEWNKILYYNFLEPGFDQTFTKTAFGVTSQNENYVITDVTMDERNPDRVWVSMGRIAPATQNGIAVHRVYYSPNHGSGSSYANSWYDISNGLPERMPVTQIIYRQGANELYAATDVGIYKCDFSSFDSTIAQNGITWTCFNNGKDPDHPFQSVYVTDIDINYCTGKLYASTQGKSIWATDLFPQSENVGYDDIITDTTNTVPWTGERYDIRGNIVVNSGVTLTIGNGSANTVIHMPTRRQDPGKKRWPIGS